MTNSSPASSSSARRTIINYQELMSSLILKAPAPKGKLVRGIKVRRAALALNVAIAALLDLWE